MGSSSAQPPNPRFRGVLELFENMRERPRRRDGDRLRPVLLTLGSAADNDELAREFADTCNEGPDPHSHIAATSPRAAGAAPVRFTDMLREIKREIAKSHPRGEPAIRFPLLDMALWLWQLRAIQVAERLPAEERSRTGESGEVEEDRLLVTSLMRSADDDDRRSELRKVVRQRGQHVLRDRRENADRSRFGTFLAYLEQIAPIGVAVVALISATAASTLDVVAAVVAGSAGLSVVAGGILARTRGWYGLRRYAWFRRQPYAADAKGADFLAFAVNLVDPRSPRHQRVTDEDLELLLVAALLEDLRRAYRRRFRRATWARVRYPVVIFERLDPEHPGSRFLRQVARVRMDAQRAPSGRRADPLMITAGIDPEHGGAGLLPELAEVPRVEISAGEPVPRDAAARLWDDYLREQRRIAVFGTRGELRVDLSRDEGGSLEPAGRPRGRPWAAHPALPWAAMVVVLAASLVVIVYEGVRFCDPHSVWRARNGECVGITDGSFSFSKRISQVEDRIEKLNRDAVRSGRPYVTLVYLGAMSTDPATRNPQADLLAGIHGELVGMSIAQQRHNEAGGQPRLRVLLANAGSKFRYAGEVAEQVRERAVDDRTIVGVVGFGQSKQATQRAVGVLSQTALPMIGTTNTFDGTARLRGGYSPYYFRLAPPNRRLAEHAALWARNGTAGPPTTSADVFYDASPDDLYSTNLAQDFADAFGRAKVRMLPYTDPSQIPGRVLEACSKPGQLFYYAGRSDEFRSFINRLANTSCGGRRTVLAGDEVTKYVSDNGAEIGRTDSFRLYFTPLAAREAWTARWVGQQPLQVFYADFDPVVAGLVGKNAAPNVRPSRAHAAIGYDAALTIISVAERVYGDQGRARPTAAAVLSALTEPDEGALPQGATGLLRFGARATGHQIMDKPVLLVTVKPDGSQEVLAVCGRLVAGAGPNADCPAKQP